MNRLSSASNAPKIETPPFAADVLRYPQQFLDVLPCAAYVCDQDGILQGYNSRAAELWGRSPQCGDPSERYCGSHRLYRTDGELVPHADCPFADVLRTGVAVRDQEVVVEQPDGTRLTVLVNIDPLRDDRGTVVGAINCFLDITAHLRAEASLREHEQLSRQILDALPAAIYTTDAEGRITYFNAAAVEFSGREPELGMDRWCVTARLYRPDGSPLPHDQCPMAVALKEGRAIRGAEAVAERPDGVRVPFLAYPTPLYDASGTVVGAVNMLIDDSERKLGEETRQRLAAIVETSDDAIVSKNLAGIIMSWNAGAERIFGYTANEIVGRPIETLIPLERWSEETEILSRIRRGERIDHYETERRRKDGALVAISLTVSPIKNGAGEIVGASKIARDITERKRAEERVRLLARETDHRANNLLSTIQAIVRMTKGSSVDVYKREVEGRVAALAKAHKLVVEAHWENIGFRQLAAQELTPYGLGENNRVRLTGDDFSVNARIGQGLALVFHELATNAAKYGALSVPDGRIDVEISLPSSTEARIVWTESGGPKVRIPSRRGFGTGLLEAVVRSDFKGALSWEWREEGLTCAFTIALDGPQRAS